MSILARKDSIWTSNEPNTERRLCTDSSSITSAFVDNHRKLYLLTHLSVGFITRSITASLSNRQKNCSLPLEVIRIVFMRGRLYMYVFKYRHSMYHFKIRYTLGISCWAVSNLNILYDL